MTAPVRLRLSRQRGFDLQAHSRALNGLPAINVARPTKWGNPHDWREWREGFPPGLLASEGPGLRDYWCRERAVEAYEDDWTYEPMERLRPSLADLRGYNLACWCPLDDGPCHADVLLRLAGAITCEAVG